MTSIYDKALRLQLAIGRTLPTELVPPPSIIPIRQRDDQGITSTLCTRRHLYDPSITSSSKVERDGLLSEARFQAPSMCRFPDSNHFIEFRFPAKLGGTARSFGILISATG